VSELEKDLELLRLAQKVVKDAKESAQKYPTSKEIQVVIVEPHKKPYKKTIQNELAQMNDIVGGYIENVFIGKYDGLKIGLVINEEGLIHKLPINRRIVGFVNPIVGTFFISAYNLQGENVSLSDDLAQTYIKRFSPLEVYL
jgi:hypothetical protein